jgi:hypothetical protein
VFARRRSLTFIAGTVDESKEVKCIERTRLLAVEVTYKNTREKELERCPGY